MYYSSHQDLFQQIQDHLSLKSQVIYFQYHYRSVESEEVGLLKSSPTRGSESAKRRLIISKLDTECSNLKFKNIVDVFANKP